MPSATPSKSSTERPACSGRRASSGVTRARMSPYEGVVKEVGRGSALERGSARPE